MCEGKCLQEIAATGVRTGLAMTAAEKYFSL